MTVYQWFLAFMTGVIVTLYITAFIIEAINNQRDREDQDV